VVDELRAREALANAAVFHGNGKDEFAWMEAGGESDDRRVYGHLELSDRRLKLETNSRKRLEIGRQLVEKHAGPHIRHVGDSFESTEAAMKRAKKEPRPAPPSLPPDIEQKLVMEYKQKHYSTWADQPLPALQGKSPRESVKTKACRKAVEDLLKDMENSENRMSKPGERFDFDPIRRDLRLIR